jgi:hypothetical protein
MIGLFLSILPLLLWDESPATAPELKKAGVERIAITGDPGPWSGTGVEAVRVDPSKMERLEVPSVDYQAGVAGATAAPWVNSNLWRMIRDRGKEFLYEPPAASVALAAAEAYTGGARCYIRLKSEDLERFASALRFLDGVNGPALPDRTNFDLIDDGSADMEEIMNLLVRRNLLFEPVREHAHSGRMEVRKSSDDPYLFAAKVRSRIGDDSRLLRLYGNDTTLARLFGDEHHARVHLLQYGRNPALGLRVRVLGRYRRVYLNLFGDELALAQDITTDETGTEFSIPELKTFAIVDLDASEPGVLHSSLAASDVPLSGDPESPFWRSAPRVVSAMDPFGRPTGSGPTETRSRWTRNSLFLLYICPFHDLYLKPDPVTDRDTPYLWDWDVAEAFIGIQGDSIFHYREFEMSPQGEWVDLDIDRAHPKPDFGMSWNSGFEVKARIDRARNIWYGEMRIPMSSLPALWPKPGDAFRLGLYRIEGPPPNRKYGSWQPLYRATYHTPESFGTLVLDQE